MQPRGRCFSIKNTGLAEAVIHHNGVRSFSPSDLPEYGDMHRA